MNEEEAQALKNRVAQLEQIISLFVRSTDYQFRRPIRGGVDGLRINTNAAEKLSFFDKNPIARWSSGSGRQDVVDNTGSAANLGARWTGNTGSTGYSGGDIVAALKAYGILNA